VRRRRRGVTASTGSHMSPTQAPGTPRRSPCMGPVERTALRVSPGGRSCPTRLPCRHRPERQVVSCRSLLVGPCTSRSPSGARHTNTGGRTSRPEWQSPDAAAVGPRNDPSRCPGARRRSASIRHRESQGGGPPPARPTKQRHVHGVWGRTGSRSAMRIASARQPELWPSGVLAIPTLPSRPSTHAGRRAPGNPVSPGVGPVATPGSPTNLGSVMKRGVRSSRNHCSAVYRLPYPA